MASVLAAEHEVTVRTVDGKSTKGKFDEVFEDGLSLVVGNDKQYLPLQGSQELWFTHQRPCARR